MTGSGPPLLVHRYPATVRRVVDGDTLDLVIDVGFRMSSVQRVRLLDYNAPESRGVEAQLGKRATLALEAMAPVGSSLIVETLKGDAFGRWLARAWLADLPDQPDLVERLVAAGYGVRWDGKGQRPAFHPGMVYPLIAATP